MNNMKNKDFEDFLMEKHAEQYIGTDDMMPDDFEDWIMDLSTDDFIDYGNKYGKTRINDKLLDKLNLAKSFCKDEAELEQVLDSFISSNLPL